MPLKKAVWCADLIERIGFLYIRGINGRVTPQWMQIHVLRARQAARALRQYAAGAEIDPTPLRRKANWLLTRKLWSDDWDLWEWGDHRFLYLREAYKICGERTVGMLLDGTVPIAPPPHIGIYDMPPRTGREMQREGQ